MGDEKKNGDLNPYLDIETLLCSPVRAPEPVEIPELEGHVLVMDLTVDEAYAFEARWSDFRKAAENDHEWYVEYRKLLVTAYVCDADGNRIMTEEHFERLGQVSVSIVDRIADFVIARFRVNEETVEEQAGK